MSIYNYDPDSGLPRLEGHDADQAEITRTPEAIIENVIVEDDSEQVDMSPLEVARTIIGELKKNGFGIRDEMQPEQPVRGEDITEGAGPDDTCGCGEAITLYDGEWLHVYNPELRGTDDHDARPGG